MRHVFRRSAAFVAIAIIGAIAPIGAKADPAWCGSNVVIFSYTAGQLALNSNAVACIAAEVVLGAPDTAPYDGRLINPGSTIISIRYTADDLGGGATTTAIVNGLGFVNESITLTRHEIVAGQPDLGVVYDSDDLSIDPAASGCITAVVPAAEDPVIGATAFHTIDASCV